MNIFREMAALGCFALALVSALFAAWELSNPGLSWKAVTILGSAAFGFFMLGLLIEPEQDKDQG